MDFNEMEIILVTIEINEIVSKSYGCAKLGLLLIA